VVLLVGIAGVIVGTMESGSAPSASRTLTAPAIRTVAMTTAAGAPVGWVNRSENVPAYLQVSISYSVPDGSYAIELRTRTRTRRLGVISVNSGHGAWSGATAVPHDSATVAMVDASGQTVCSATLA
jgi:hypothetical protein